MQRKAAGNKSWEETFLARETWRNLRISCRGFFEYCRAIIKFAGENKESIPEFHGISVAHSNTSVLEAWFALVRNMRLDSASTYGSMVGNKEMRTACSLVTNRMYAPDQVGPISIEYEVEPNEVLQFHSFCMRSCP